MRRVLPIAVTVLLVSSAVRADHISIYSDVTATSCVLAAGFNSNITLMERFSLGSTSARFSVTKGDNEFLAFNTPYSTVGNLTSDITVSYGNCMSGSIVIGLAVMNLVVGGHLYIDPAQGQSQVLYTDCEFIQHTATSGSADVGRHAGCDPPFAVEPSTWGAVKSLYR